MMAPATDKPLPQAELGQRAHPPSYTRITQRALARGIKAVRANALAQSLPSWPPSTRVNERTLAA
jgi:hypothetical protein